MFLFIENFIEFIGNFIEKFRFRLLAKLIRLYWWAEEAKPLTIHPAAKNIFFEPISTTALLTSLLVSGISFGAQLIISTLMQPKPKPQVRGKLTGDMTVTDSIFGAPMYDIFGGRDTDNYGGIEVGANIIWLPRIDKIQTTVPSGGGSGGGKGRPRTPPTIQIDYRCDMAAGIGRGPLRLLRIKLNQDTVYNVDGTGTGTSPNVTRYEAEAPGNTLSGGAAIAADTNCSNNQKVTGIGNGGVLVFNNVDGDSLYRSAQYDDTEEPPETTPYLDIRIKYKASGDMSANVLLDGGGGVYTFPATGATPGTKYILRDYSPGPHTIEINNPGGAAPDIDCIDIGVIFLNQTGPTGVLDLLYPAEAPQDNILIPDPRKPDTNAFERYNGKTEMIGGVLETTLPNGANLAFYEGTADQPIDPVIAAQIDAQYGANSTPAFRHCSYLRLQNLTISKYGAIPNIRVLVENTLTKKVSEICLKLALDAGLHASDTDFTAAAAMHCRGIYKMPDDAPEKIFEQLATVFDIAFVETSDGKVTIKDLSDRTPVAQIYRRDLGAYIVDETESPPADAVVTTIEDASELIRTSELQFINPKTPSDYGTDRVSYTYPFTTSTRTETKSVNVVLLPEEAEKINRRALQKHHLKQTAPLALVVPHKFSWLDAADCIEVEVADGEMKLVRIEEKIGSAPGIYEIAASSEDVFVDGDSTTTAKKKTIPSPVTFPANTVGTLIDVPALEEPDDGKKGIYIAACPKSEDGAWAGCTLYREKAEGFARMATVSEAAAIGRAVNALGDIPSGYAEGVLDPVNQLTVDFYGSFEPSTVTQTQADEGANAFVVGGEVLVIRDWTRVNGFPNRWTGSNIYRTLKNTEKQAPVHLAGERVVYLNSAVKFLPLDSTEIDKSRTWKFVTAGQRIEDAAPIDFEWKADNDYNRAVDAPVIGQVFDATETQIRIGVRNYKRDANYRKIEIADNSMMTAGLESQTVAADEFPHSYLPTMFALTRNAGKNNNETKYVRVSHSSNGKDFGPVSNVLTVTFADAAGTGGTTGGFSPNPEYTLDTDG